MFKIKVMSGIAVALFLGTALPTMASDPCCFGRTEKMSLVSASLQTFRKAASAWKRFPTANRKVAGVCQAVLS